MEKGVDRLVERCDGGYVGRIILEHPSDGLDNGVCTVDIRLVGCPHGLGESLARVVEAVATTH